MPPGTPKSFFSTHYHASTCFWEPARSRSAEATWDGLLHCTSVLKRSTNNLVWKPVFINFLRYSCWQRRFLIRQGWAPSYCTCFFWRRPGDISPVFKMTATPHLSLGTWAVVRIHHCLPYSKAEMPWRPCCTQCPRATLRYQTHGRREERPQRQGASRERLVWVTALALPAAPMTLRLLLQG